MASGNPVPTLLAFLICDTVIQDAGSKKRTLVGVFDRIWSPIAPFAINSLGLYAKMVDGSGQYVVKVRMVNLTRDETPVMEIKANVDWKDPDEAMELGMNFAGLPLPDFGMYEIQLFADDAYIGRALLKALKMQIPPGAPPSPSGR
jgi:hypothetical protein